MKVLLLALALVACAPAAGAPSTSPPKATARSWEMSVVHWLQWTGTSSFSFLVDVSDVSSGEMPINPLYFTVESSGRVFSSGYLDTEQRRALASKYGDDTPLPLVTLHAGQSTRGWVTFDLSSGLAPTALVFNDTFGHRMRLTIP